MSNTLSNSEVLNAQVDDTWIPEGFVLVIGPDNQKYIVPEYAVPDLEQNYLSKKKELRATNAQGSVSISFFSF